MEDNIAAPLQNPNTLLHCVRLERRREIRHQEEDTHHTRCKCYFRHHLASRGASCSYHNWRNKELRQPLDHGLVFRSLESLPQRQSHFRQRLQFLCLEKAQLLCRYRTVRGLVGHLDLALGVQRARCYKLGSRHMPTCLRCHHTARHQGRSLWFHAKRSVGAVVVGIAGDRVGSPRASIKSVERRTSFCPQGVVEGIGGGWGWEMCERLRLDGASGVI